MGTHVTRDEITCFRILLTRRKREVAYIRQVSAMRKLNMVIQFSMDKTRFRRVSASETNDHVSVTFLLGSNFRPFLFSLRFR